MKADQLNHIDFNQGWQVRRPTGPFAAFNDGPPKVTPVTLPHDALREEPRHPDVPAGAASGYHPSAAYTYEKTWDVPADWAGKWVALQFDGVASNALVYLNKVLVAQRPYTYARFTADLTALLKPGQSNHLRVEVRGHKDSRWYTGAGIYRGVELLVGNLIHFAPDSLAVSTVKITDDRAHLDVAAVITNASATVREVRVRFEIRDPAGELVVTREVPVTVMPVGNSSVAATAADAQILQHIELPSPALWSVKSPILYTVTAEILDPAESNSVLATESTRFGVRTVSVSTDRGFQLNGETLKLRGACIHVDNGLLGAVSLKSVERRKVSKLQQAGFNAIRISHNPASQALLEACDELGMLVRNEAFDTWSLEKSEFDHARNFAEWWERDIDALVHGSRNHPSVVLYSIGNEIPELGTIGGRILNRKIANRVRAIDPTRPVTNGINTLLTIDVGDLLAQAGGLNAFMGDTGDISAGFANIAVTPTVSGAIEEVASALDVIGYNYAESRYALDEVESPHRIIVGSETFAKTIVANWALVEKYPQVIGDFTWTGYDYLGEVGIGAVAYKEDEGFNGQLNREFPYLLAYCGDIDITGYRRPAAYYREIAFGLRTQPYIAVQDPSKYNFTQVSTSPWAWADRVEGWSWAGYEGKPVRLEVYSAADEIELLLNGVSVSRQPVRKANAGKDLANTVAFELNYQPGELVAVAYTDGRESGRSKLVSATGSARLQVVVDEAEGFEGLDAAGQNAAHLYISVVGENGVLLNQAQEQFEVSVTGSGVLAGAGSSLPDPTVPYTTNVQSTYDGRALVIVRATGAGEVTVTVGSGALGSASLKLIAS